jgi:hypothetical protein
VLPVTAVCLAVVALAAGVVIGATAVGGAVVAVVAALCVVVAGVWFSRAPVSETYLRELGQQVERHSEARFPDEFLLQQTRRDRRAIGLVAMIAGGVWLAFALAAL